MTRYLYGNRPADFTYSGGAITPGSTLNAYDSFTGGTAITDLLTAGGGATTTVTSGSDGRISFQGPDGYRGTIYLDSGVGARYPMEPIDIASSLAAGTAKRVTLSIGGDMSYSSNSFADLLFRPGIVLPVTTSRWRLRIANQNTGGAISGAVSMTAVYLGVPTFASGQYRGLASGLTQALTAPTLSSTGSETVTPWVTSAALQFTADTPAVLSFGFTTAGGVTMSRGDNMTVCFYTAGAAAQVAATSPTGSMTVQAAFMDVRLEFEAYTSMPVLLGVGDSTMSRQVDDATLAPAFPGPSSSMLGIAALRDRFLWVNAAVAGNETAQFSSSSVRYTRFDLTTTVPDAAIIATGINDSAVYTRSGATFITNYQGAVAYIKSLGIKRVFASTITPQPNFKGGALLASAAAAATSIQTSVAYASGDVVTLGHGTTRAETKTLAAASTGTVAPFTTTIPALTNAHPVGEPMGIATEELRRTYNDYLYTDPTGCEGTWDFDQAVRDPWNPYTLEAKLIGAGTIHAGQGFQERIARLITLR